jgi:hypothetical protein
MPINYVAEAQFLFRIWRYKVARCSPRLCNLPAWPSMPLHCCEGRLHKRTHASFFGPDRLQAMVLPASSATTPYSGADSDIDAVAAFRESQTVTVCTVQCQTGGQTCGA